MYKDLIRVVMSVVKDKDYLRETKTSGFFSRISGSMGLEWRAKCKGFDGILCLKHKGSEPKAKIISIETPDDNYKENIMVLFILSYIRHRMFKKCDSLKCKVCKVCVYHLCDVHQDYLQKEN